MHKQFFADVLVRRPVLWQRLLQANLPEGGPRLPDDCREQTVFGPGCNSGR